MVLKGSLYRGGNKPADMEKRFILRKKGVRNYNSEEGRFSPKEKSDGWGKRPKANAAHSRPQKQVGRKKEVGA